VVEGVIVSSLVVLAAAALLLAAAGDSEARASRPVRAMWVWATPAVRSLLSDAAAWPAFFGFCAAPHGSPAARISVLYLEPPADLEASALRAFLSRAHSGGMKVEALVGDGDWQPGHLAGVQKACAERIDGFNPAGAEDERFDGIHLDIENGGKWSQKAFRDLLASLRRAIDAYNSRQPQQMTLAADLGFSWLERGDDAKPQFGDAIQLCDSIVTMAYRDTAGAQASCAVPQAMAAAKRRKPQFLGAETQWLVDQDFVTYYEEGWEHMERELARLPDLVTGHGGRLAGIAVHHYDSYVTMVREPRKSPFSDVRLDHWASPSIMAVRRAGIIAGYPDGTYKPSMIVAREQMAVYVTHALLGRENVPEGPPTASFPDVSPDYWAYKWVECARARGLTLGCGDGLYHPQDPLDRAQMAAFIARAIVDPAGEEGLASYLPPERPTFPDVTPDGEWSWAYRYVEYLAGRTVVGGYRDGLFHPETPCTRDQIAVYLSKAFRLPIEL
jgi:hypothetical protein